MVLAHIDQPQYILHIRFELRWVLLAATVDILDHQLIGSICGVLRKYLLLDAVVEDINPLLGFLKPLQNGLVVILHDCYAIKVAAVYKGDHLIEGCIIFSFLRLLVHFL